MNYAGLLRGSLVALLRNKLRSVLTVLGITLLMAGSFFLRKTVARGGAAA